MRFALPLGLTALAAAAGFTVAALAGPAEDFTAAYAKAEAASQQAVARKTQWTTTVATLHAAQAAAAAGKYDDAIVLARQAEALAEASIAQAKEQETAWRDGVIR
jgi:hypothetical protein